VTSTTDPNDVRGLYHALPKFVRRKLLGDTGRRGGGSGGTRLFPVGRLDLDSRGLVRFLVEPRRLSGAPTQASRISCKHMIRETWPKPLRTYPAKLKTRPFPLSLGICGMAYLYPGSD
jgi:hypothetical protein